MAAYRIVKISNRCKLETSLGYLVVRGDDEKRILLDEISILIIENLQTCLTSALISELMNHKVRVVFCNDKHNPQGEIEPYGECYNSPFKIRQQLNWSQLSCDSAWREIIRQKIHNQRFVAAKLRNDPRTELLVQYEDELVPGDKTNREGLAAKVYFNVIFGDDFERRDDNDYRNAFLNYGYSLMHSSVNKDIAIYGYFNPIGIHHVSETNHYNLGSDIMEPLRPFVDRVVLSEKLDEDTYKKRMLKLLTEECSCGGKTMIIQNAITSYVQSVFSALNQDDATLIKQIGFLDE